MHLRGSKLVVQSIRRYSSEIPLPPCDFVPKQYKGPSLQRLKDLKQARMNQAVKQHFTEPLGIHQGYKQWLFDFEGRRYLDFFAGIVTVSVGHSHPKVTEAVSQQIGTVGHLANIYMNPKVYEYAERLTDKFPGDLKVAFFVNSGSEATDLAIMLARAYTNNFDIVGFRNCYHGMGSEVGSLTTNASFKHFPQNAGYHHVMNPDIYRGLWGGKNCRDSPIQAKRDCNCSANKCDASQKYMDQFMEVFNFNMPKNRVAAFFAESIQGVGGVVQYPKEYIKNAYNAVKERGGLFVSDEVQSGFARTGDHYWGFEMHGIVPDIVTMAKGIGNGFPLGAVVTTAEIAKALTRAGYFNTFGGNPVASAAGIAVLDVIEEEKMQLNSKIVGTYLLEKLSELRNEFPVIGDVRGKGLMIGLELVSGKGDNTPMDLATFMKFWERCRDLGLLLGRGGYFLNVIRIKPPMCVTKADADFALAVIRKSLSEL